MPPELCQCQLGTHGHEPGKCPEPASEEDRLCKSCRDKAVVANVAPGGAAVGVAWQRAIEKIGERASLAKVPVTWR
jgi:hypothetical protein